MPRRNVGIQAPRTGITEALVAPGVTTRRVQPGVDFGDVIQRMMGGLASVTGGLTRVAELREQQITADEADRVIAGQLKLGDIPQMRSKKAIQLLIDREAYKAVQDWRASGGQGKLAAERPDETQGEIHARTAAALSAGQSPYYQQKVSDLMLPYTTAEFAARQAKTQDNEIEDTLGFVSGQLADPNIPIANSLAAVDAALETYKGRVSANDVYTRIVVPTAKTLAAAEEVDTVNAIADYLVAKGRPDLAVGLTNAAIKAERDRARTNFERDFSLDLIGGRMTPELAESRLKEAVEKGVLMADEMQRYRNLLGKRSYFMEAVMRLLATEPTGEAVLDEDDEAWLAASDAVGVVDAEPVNDSGTQWRVKGLGANLVAMANHFKRRIPNDVVDYVARDLNNSDSAAILARGIAAYAALYAYAGKERTTMAFPSSKFTPRAAAIADAIEDKITQTGPFMDPYAFAASEITEVMNKKPTGYTDEQLSAMHWMPDKGKMPDIAGVAATLIAPYHRDKHIKLSPQAVADFTNLSERFFRGSMEGGQSVEVARTSANVRAAEIINRRIFGWRGETNYLPYDLPGVNLSHLEPAAQMALMEYASTRIGAPPDNMSTLQHAYWLMANYRPTLSSDLKSFIFVSENAESDPLLRQQKMVDGRLIEVPLVLGFNEVSELYKRHSNLIQAKAKQAKAKEPLVGTALPTFESFETYYDWSPAGQAYRLDEIVRRVRQGEVIHNVLRDSRYSGPWSGDVAERLRAFAQEYGIMEPPNANTR